VSTKRSRPSAGTNAADRRLPTEAAKHRGDRPVVAVIHTHSHVDHFGGVEGVTSQEDVDAGKVQIIATDGFVEHGIRGERLRRHSGGRRELRPFVGPIKAANSTHNGSIRDAGSGAEPSGSTV